MFHFLFRCVGCEGPFLSGDRGQFFPLCGVCAESLYDCPNLCDSCASPACVASETRGRRAPCLRPWVHRPEVDSYSARYLLLGPTYRVLKRWKAKRGVLFSRQVLKPDTALIQKWKNFGAGSVVPVPQRFARSWKLRGSPALELAHWVAVQLNLPVVEGLGFSSSSPSHPASRKHPKRQAEMSLTERLQHRMSFQVLDQVLEPLVRYSRRVILVDDFMTTGHTLIHAAEALRKSGVQNVHAFCLGVKLSRQIPSQR